LIKVAHLKDIPPGKSKKVTVQNQCIAIFNVDGKLYAVDNACTHRGESLAMGSTKGTHLTCKWHGAIFDLETGKALARPAKGDLRTYEVTVEGDEIFIKMASD